MNDVQHYPATPNARQRGTADSPRSAVVILNWCNEAGSRLCLTYWLDGTRPAPLVVLVNSASPDGSGDRLARDFPGAVYLPLAANEGYAVGNNAGISLALERGAEAVLLLNPDVKLPPGDLLEAMVNAFRLNEGLGVLNPLVCFSDLDSRRNYREYRIGPYYRSVYRILLGRLPDGFFEKVENGLLERPFALGCAMMIYRDCLERNGYLDERYFMYGVELDYCLRARRQGFSVKLLVESGTTVVHRTGLEKSRWRAYFDGRNQFLYLRHFRVDRQLLLLPVFTASLFKKTIVDLCRGEWTRMSNRLRGFVAGAWIWLRSLAGNMPAGKLRHLEKQAFARLRR